MGKRKQQSKPGDTQNSKLKTQNSKLFHPPSPIPYSFVGKAEPAWYGLPDCVLGAIAAL
ncbi:MAG: hypothetical protein ACAF41_29785 [Leptolyngbya sp. BL-A-14]